MADDLVDRLRARCAAGSGTPKLTRYDIRAAADEIERLRAADTHERLTAEERDGLLAERVLLRAEIDVMAARVAD